MTVVVCAHLVRVGLNAESLADGDDLEQKRQVALPSDRSEHVRVVVKNFLP